MKNIFKDMCIIMIIVLISMSLGYEICYIMNKNKIKKNDYDVNNDGKISAVDYVLIKNYIMDQP